MCGTGTQAKVSDPRSSVLSRKDDTQGGWTWRPLGVGGELVPSSST